MPEGWEWDESLYEGSAAYYSRGRLPYASDLANALAERLSLDGCGRLIDIGCGPGTLSLLLAHLFQEAVGVDPDAEMLEEARRQATVLGIGNVRWVRTRAEELPVDMGPFRVATFGQSFHWMDRPRVAAIVFDLLESGGAFVHINDNKDYLRSRQVENAIHPAPPYAAIADLVKRHLGPVRRAGQGNLRFGTPGRQELILTDAGFTFTDQLIVPSIGSISRTIGDVIAWVFSRSDSAPHLFGNDRQSFEEELREVLLSASPAGLFTEELPETELDILRKP